MTGPAREMTLDEFLARLPESHAAKKELQRLREALREREQDAERWRAFRDGWEYQDAGGHIVTLAQEVYWDREHAPGSEAAAIESHVAGYRDRMAARGVSSGDQKGA